MRKLKLIMYGETGNPFWYFVSNIDRNEREKLEAGHEIKAAVDTLGADGKDVSLELDWKSLVKYDTQSSFHIQSFKEYFRRTVQK
jgi:hypothetical protein